MKLSPGEIAYIGRDFPDKTSVSLFSILNLEVDEDVAKSLEEKNIYENSLMAESAREIFEVVAHAKHSARLILQDKFVFVEKFVYRLGQRLVLVENDSGNLVFSPLLDISRIGLEIGEFTGMSQLKTVNVEVGLDPRDMLVLLAIIDSYREDTLLYHLGRQDMFEDLALESDDEGEVYGASGLGVCAGLRDIGFFIMENDLIELSSLSGSQLIGTLENFIKCPPVKGD